MKKSVISLISYDAIYLPESIRRYYDYVDEIVLGLDKSRVTWNNNKFTFDEEALWSSLQKLDTDNKITIVEENFHPTTVAIQNDNYERNFLKEQCSNDWILSIDADEYILNAKKFFYDFCPLAAPYYKSHDICMTWVTPYKIIEDKVLLIVNEDNTPFFGENQGVVTNKDSTYTYARWTDKSAAGDNRIQSPLVTLHWSLARPKEALSTKIQNTGHADIADRDPFYTIWKDVTLQNYSQLRNFKTSGLGGQQWPKLLEMPLASLESYIMSNIERAY